MNRERADVVTPMVPRSLALGLMIWTLAVTVARTVRWPNDFAEAHWLLSYRYGFIKRGLAGEALSWVLDAFGARPSERILQILAILAFAAFLVVILMLALRVVRHAQWSRGSLLVVIAFLSSPFIVMSGHLVGYFDNLLLLMNAGAILLMVRGRPWAAGALQTAAVFVHEGALLFGFPVLALTWLLVRRRTTPATSSLASWPLLLPGAAFVAIVVAGQLYPMADMQEQFTRYLARFAFIGGDMDVLVPRWLLPSFFDLYAEQSRHFAARIAAPGMFGLVLPTIFALFCYVIDAHGIRGASIVVVATLAAIFAPQLMHLSAWDTARIWTFSIGAAFMVAWVHAKIDARVGDVSWAVQWLSLAAILVNVMVMTPLLDNLSDRYALTTRLLLYAPVLACGTALMFRARPDELNLPRPDM